MVKHHNSKEIFGETGAKFGMAAMAGKEKITARIAGAMDDMHLPVSPASVTAKAALRNMAKAINLALKSDFIESDLDLVYKAARVHANQVEVLHHQYIGLGNGLFAKIGKTDSIFLINTSGTGPSVARRRKMVQKTWHQSSAGSHRSHRPQTQLNPLIRGQGPPPVPANARCV